MRPSLFFCLSAQGRGREKRTLGGDSLSVDTGFQALDFRWFGAAFGITSANGFAQKCDP